MTTQINQSNKIESNLTTLKVRTQDLIFISVQEVGTQRSLLTITILKDSCFVLNST